MNRNTVSKGIKFAGRSARSLGSAAFRTTGMVAEHALLWSTKDHLGVGKMLSRMPSMGLLDSLAYIAGVLFAGIVGALVAGLMAFLIVAYGIPLVIHILFM